MAGEADELLLVRRDERGVVTVTMNRPAVHNAFDEHLIAALCARLEALGADPAVRVMVLTGSGRSFSAGADLGWMSRMAEFDDARNLADARDLARLMQVLNELPKPTIAAVNGAALGGGAGLACACDIAVAVDRAVFGTTEVRLGLIASVIGPYVVAAIGQRQARRLMLTGERISAAEARKIGLLHEVVPPDGLAAAVERFVQELLKNGPKAMAASKALVRDLAGRPIDAAVIEETAVRIAQLRKEAEARAGMAAFLAKRAPDWTA